MRHLESPYDEHGNFRLEAWVNVCAAILLKSGGCIELSERELQAPNLRQIQYEQTDRGTILFTMIDTRCGEA